MNFIIIHFRYILADWFLFGEQMECHGIEFYRGHYFEVWQCAESCRGISSRFAFGTNDGGVKKCTENGCPCFCETAAENDGSCMTMDSNGYNSYKFGYPTSGKNKSRFLKSRFLFS